MKTDHIVEKFARDLIASSQSGAETVNLGIDEVLWLLSAIRTDVEVPYVHLGRTPTNEHARIYSKRDVAILAGIAISAAIYAKPVPSDRDAGNESLMRAIVAGVARWVPSPARPDARGEICVGGMCYGTRVKDGLPVIDRTMQLILDDHVRNRVATPATSAG